MSECASTPSQIRALNHGAGLTMTPPVPSRHGAIHSRASDLAFRSESPRSFTNPGDPPSAAWNGAGMELERNPVASHRWEPAPALPSIALPSPFLTLPSLCHRSVIALSSRSPQRLGLLDRPRATDGVGPDRPPSRHLTHDITNAPNAPNAPLVKSAGAAALRRAMFRAKSSRARRLSPEVADPPFPRTAPFTVSHSVRDTAISADGGAS